MGVVSSDVHDTLMYNSQVKQYYIKKVCGVTVQLRDVWRDRLLQILYEKFSVEEAHAKYEKVSNLTYTTDEGLSRAEFVEGAADAIKRIRAAGLTFVFITASGPYAFDPLKRRLAEGGFGDILCVTSGRHGNKVARAREHHVRYYLDNRLRPLHDLDGVVAHRFLISRPNNHEFFPLQPEWGIALAKSWSDYADAVLRRERTGCRKSSGARALSR